jgi:hypothetical protein
MSFYSAVRFCFVFESGEKERIRERGEEGGEGRGRGGEGRGGRKGRKERREGGGKLGVVYWGDGEEKEKNMRKIEEHTLQRLISQRGETFQR